MRVVIKLAGAKERTQKLIAREKQYRQANPAGIVAKKLAELDLLGTRLQEWPIRGDLAAFSMNITRGELRFLYKSNYLSYAELAQLMGVPKAKIECWLKPCKPDDAVLPFKRLDFIAAEKNAPRKGERWNKILAQAFASMGKK